MNISTAANDLFLTLANEAGDWDGTPIVDIPDNRIPQLNELEGARLITVFIDGGDGCGDMYAQFTADGVTHAARFGVDLSDVQTCD